MTNAINICVQSTRDYTSIKKTSGNRSIDPANVAAIKESMKEEQLIVPAIVNEYMELIDGQHRLTACAELGLPFYYIVVVGYTLRHVQQINANAHNWSTQDYLESFVERYDMGEKEFTRYKELSGLMAEFSIPLATARALSDIYYTLNFRKKAFEKGTFVFRDKNTFRRLASILTMFKEKAPTRWKTKDFAMVVAKLATVPTFNLTQLENALPKIDAEYYRSARDTKTTTTAILNMYNKDKREVNKINTFDIEMNWRDATVQARSYE